jgi:hypothetical protein
MLFSSNSSNLEPNADVPTISFVDVIDTDDKVVKCATVSLDDKIKILIFSFINGSSLSQRDFRNSVHFE